MVDKQHVLDALENALDYERGLERLDDVQKGAVQRLVLQAASVINKHIDSVDDPVAHKLEGVLASFRCQMWLEMSHSMKSTHLTDYFHHF